MSFDLTKITEKIQAKFAKKDPRRAKQIGVGNNLANLTEKDYIIMPEFWQKATNTLGLPFGRTVIIAGKTDSGKTSVAIQAMKCAQDQGVAIIYVETENKTSTDDLVAWGVDPSQVIVIKASVAEEAFDLLFEAWDAFKDKYPEAPLLVIFDSIGNAISQRDNNLNMVEQSSQPGGKGKSNRLGISKMTAKRDQDRAAILLISYTYANLGSIGVTVAGGDANMLFASLVYRTNRMGDIEKTVKGEKKKIGTKVIWSLVKNHINKKEPGPKKIQFNITAEGMEYVEGKEE